MGLTRGNTEKVNIFTGKVLNANALNPISEGFPFGEAFTRLILRIHLSITHVDGATVLTEGELKLLKSLSFKTSAGEMVYNSVPGIAMDRLNTLKCKTPAPAGTIAAATAIYTKQYNLWFIDPLLVRPEDFLLNTIRYNRLQLDLNLGGIADLLSVPGDDTLAITADLIAERIRGTLPKEISPNSYTEIGNLSPVDPSALQYLDLEKSPDLGIKRIFLMSQNSATLGVPFSGTPVDTAISKIGFDTDRGELINKIAWTLLNAENKQAYGLETAIVGGVVLEFCQDGSQMSALPSGAFSRFRAFWDNGSLSTTQISAVYEGFRPLK